MPSSLKALIVAFCGLCTALLTGIVATVIERATGFSIHTFALWFVVPVGAIATGLASASGFYFASLYLHARPTRATLVQIVVVGGLSYFLIHYVQYFTLVLDDGTRAADVIAFGPYLDLVLTKSHYSIGTGSGGDVGEVGRFGYLLAALQICGFLAGGGFAYATLKDHPFCDRCEKFLRPLGASSKQFADSHAASSYHDALFGLRADSPEFAQMVAASHQAKASKGVVQVVLKLLGCPACKVQAIRKCLQVHDGRNWKDVDASAGLVPIPAGANVAPAFRPNR